jgi:hypothetical protein
MGGGREKRGPTLAKFGDSHSARVYTVKLTQIQTDLPIEKHERINTIEENT